MKVISVCIKTLLFGSMLFFFVSCGGGGGSESSNAGEQVVKYPYPDLSTISAENKALAQSLEETQAALLQAILLTNSYIYTDSRITDFSTYENRRQRAIDAFKILDEKINITLADEEAEFNVEGKIVFSRELKASPLGIDALVSTIPQNGSRPIKNLMQDYQNSTRVAMDTLELPEYKISQENYQHYSEYEKHQKALAVAVELARCDLVYIGGIVGIAAVASVATGPAAVAGTVVVLGSTAVAAVGQYAKLVIAIVHWKNAEYNEKQEVVPFLLKAPQDVAEFTAIVNLGSPGSFVLYGTDKMLDLIKSGGKTISFGSEDINVKSIAESTLDIKRWTIDPSKWPTVEPGVYITPDGKEIKVTGGLPIEYDNILSKLKSKDRLIHNCPLEYDSSLDADGNYNFNINITDKDNDGHYEDRYLCTYYTSGHLKMEYPFFNDERYGIQKEYYESGVLYKESYFIDGKQNGVQNTYYESGQLEYSVPYVNGVREGEYRDYYESGALYRKIPYVKGVQEGTVYGYYESGQLKFEIPYVKGALEGEAREYYESGQLYNTVDYVNDVREGEYKEYYESGQLKLEMPFVNDIKEGVYKEYYESGQPYYEVPYVNDVREGELKEYYESGPLYRKIPYVNGIQEGMVYGYYESGQLNYTIPYVNGQKNGTETYYHANGDYNLNPWVNGQMNGNAPYYTKGKDGYEMTGCDTYVNDVIVGSCMPKE